MTVERPTSVAEAATGVWADLVGQSAAVEALRRAVAGEDHAMTHGWLITGPPGSGRSNAARAFAAALLCERGGCGECAACRTALTGSHPDVTLVHTELLSIGVEEIRELVRMASMSPTMGRYLVVVIEDADRITERGADALLKSLEEPPARTVWILCAPSNEDVIVTIRSRTRELRLVTPSTQSVTELLVRRDRIDPVLAAHAARASQGHIGRARVLARSEEARNAREAIRRIPGELTSLGACLTAAEDLVNASKEGAAAQTAHLDAAEKAELSQAFGMGSKGSRARHVQAALKDLEEQQRLRAKRLQRDELDRVLTELTTWYRDVLSVQTGAVRADDLHDATASAGLINADARDRVAAQARAATSERTLRRIDALLACRVALETNVAPLLAMEALMLKLQNPDR